MPPHCIPDDLLPWALSALGVAASGPEPALAVVAGDASNRRYFRLALPGASYIVVEAPPATEKNARFLAVREALALGRVRVPDLHAADLERGYLLLEDLGDRLLLGELTAASADACYQRAFNVLHRMLQVDVRNPQWPAYDAALLGEELSRFPAWFVETLLDYSLSADERELWQRFSQLILDSALEQPRVLVHRDFHSRNLMPQTDGQLAVIDFQDAVRGPITYDLVSLLRDCYIRWPAERVQTWALQYLDYLQRMGFLDQGQGDKFLRWFDWMGLQRHIKVLGTFARLSLRDGKPGYLEDLPLVIAYVEEILDKYADDEPLFADFLRWFRERLSPLIAGQSWSAAS